VKKKSNETNDSVMKVILMYENENEEDENIIVYMKQWKYVNEENIWRQWSEMKMKEEWNESEEIIISEEEQEI